MEQDLVNAEISSEDLTVLNTALATIKNKLPFLISLSPKEKASLSKVGDTYKPFIAKASQAVTMYPEIMPGVFDKPGFLRDYNLFTSLEPVLTNLQGLVKALDDTITAAGSDALVSSYEVYGEVKDNADRIPGLKALYDEMKAYFPRKRSAQKATTTEGQ